MKNISRNFISDAMDEDLYGYAVELAKAHLDLYPKDDFVWFELGRAFTELSRFEEAEKAFESTYEHAPETVREIIFTARGRMYKRQGNYQEAENWYRRAVEVGPDNANNYIYLGILLFQRGDINLAVETYRQGINCSEGCVDECYANLGSVLVAQEKYEEAVECFKAALKIDPQYKWAQLRLLDVQEVLNFKIKFD